MFEYTIVPAWFLIIKLLLKPSTSRSNSEKDNSNTMRKNVYFFRFIARPLHYNVYIFRILFGDRLYDLWI